MDIEEMTEERAAELIMTARAPWFAEERRRVTRRYFQHQRKPIRIREYRMAQVTVEQLATTVGASVERLLAQMKEAGLPHAAADRAGVRRRQANAVGATLSVAMVKHEGPKKITLKRKQVSTLRTGGAGKRTVNVEVRKKAHLRQA